MTTQFDASFVYTGPIGEEVAAAHRHEVERSVRMLGALGNAKLHAQRELDRWVLACNRLVWGAMPDDTRKPTPQEIAHVLEYLGAENGERLLRESRLAAEARNLVDLLSAAEIEAHAWLEAQQAEDERAEAEARARQEAQQAEEARKEAELIEWQEFEAYDAAQKEARFQAWRASRRK
jgi:hypothetical protein